VAAGSAIMTFHYAAVAKTIDTSPRISEMQRLFASRHTERIDANEALFHEAESHWIFEVVSGCVRNYTLRRDGRRSIVSVSVEGDYCGNLFEGTNSLVTEAVTQIGDEPFFSELPCCYMSVGASAFSLRQTFASSPSNGSEESGSDDRDQEGQGC